MAWPLTARTAIPEDSHSISSTHMQLITVYTPIARGPDIFFQPPWNTSIHIIYTHTCSQNDHVHQIIDKLIKAYWVTKQNE